MKKIFIAIAALIFTVSGLAQPIPKVKMADVVNNFTNQGDTVYIVSFWATFCKPCIAEIPGFIKITNEYKDQKVKLLLVSVDLPSFYPKKIALFAAKNNFNTNIAWLDETNADHFCPLIDKNWSGSIPATIIVNSKAGYKKFFEEEITASTFEEEIKRALQAVKLHQTHSIDPGGNADPL